MKALRFIRILFAKFPGLLAINTCLLVLTSLFEAGAVLSIAPLVDFLIYPDLQAASGPAPSHAPSGTCAVRCIIFRQNKNTGALVRDIGTLRVSSNFFWVLGRFGSRKKIFSNFGDFLSSRSIFLTMERCSGFGGFWCLCTGRHGHIIGSAKSRKSLL